MYLTSNSIVQNADPNHFSLVEVMLDKGVSERELNEDEKPWLIIQKKKRVSKY